MKYVADRVEVTVVVRWVVEEHAGGRTGRMA